MCESKADGGRRCPCDAPEARAARRHAKNAASAAPEGGIGAGGTASPITDGALPGLPDTWDPDSIREYADVVSAGMAGGDPIKDTDGTVLTLEQMDQGVGSRGIPYSDTERAAQAAFLRLGGSLAHAEQAVTALGAKVAEEAERRAGTSAAEIAEYHQGLVADAVAKSDAAHKEMEAARATYEAHPLSVAADEAIENARERGTKYAQTKADKAVKASEDTEEYRLFREAMDRANAAYREREKVEFKTPLGVRERLGRLRNAYKEVLSELRPLGGEVDLHSDSDPQSVRTMASVSNWFPSDWVGAHNERSHYGGQVMVQLSGHRGHYNAYGNRETEGTIRVAVIDHNSTEETVEEVDRPEVSYGKVGDDTSTQRALMSMADGDEEMIAMVRERANRQTVHHYDVVTVPEGNPAPDGPGWTRYEGAAQEKGKTIWRRPKTNEEQSYVPTMVINPREEVTTARRNARAVAAHEMAHRFEHVIPGIKTLEGEFVRRRTTNPETGERDAPVSALDGPDQTFEARPDSFADVYMSKEYPEGSREVMSTGMEALFSGSYGGLVGTHNHPADPDMRAFVLGVLAGVHRQGGPRV